MTLGKMWNDLVIDDDGLLREVTPAPKAHTPTLGVHRDGAWTVTLRLTTRNLLLFVLLAVCCGLIGGTIVAGAVQWERAALVERVEGAEALARGALAQARAPMSAYERCEDDLRTAWVLFQGDIGDVNPPSCTPPRVTREEYVRAFDAVGGGTEWVGVPDGQAAP
jgi:hypothetical protein